MRSLHIVLLIMLLASPIHPAYIYGDIYDAGLEKHNRTVLSVKGELSYQLVTDSPNYSLFLPEGGYNISASYYDEEGRLLMHAKEEVNVGSQNQRVDLVLRPVSDNMLLYIAAFILLMIIAMHIGFRKGEEHPVALPEERKKPTLDAEGKKVLRAIEGFGGRVTQKELRLALRYQDAKLSLILAELEELGHISKFKRGRGNIIRKN